MSTLVNQQRQAVTTATLARLRRESAQLTAPHLLGGILVSDGGPDGVSLLQELLGQLCAGVANIDQAGAEQAPLSSAQGWQAISRRAASSM